MKGDLSKYIPEGAIAGVQELLSHDNLLVKVKRKRKTKHGDYRKLSDGSHLITVNDSRNPYRFLMTLIHEIAHFKVSIHYMRKVKPHGNEWKMTFQKLMLPFINPEIYPSHLLPLLAKHFKNPKASSNSDHQLFYELKQYDPPNNKQFVFEIDESTEFIAQNGRQYKRGKKRVKRIECWEISTGRLWLFNPNAEVELLDKKNL